MRLALNSATRWAGGERTLGSDGRALNHLDPAQPGDPRGRRRSRDRGAHASQTRPLARRIFPVARRRRRGPDEHLTSDNHG